jgi:hypothetical protein
MWAPPPPSRRGVFISYLLNAANSDPTSWKCGVVRCPHRCLKIPAQVLGSYWLHLKGQPHEIFNPRFFSLNNTPGSPDSWAKSVLNIDLHWRSNLIRFDAKNRLHAMPHCVESIFVIDNAKLKILFYCHGAGKITYY